ncbi:hypothetical protein Hanom_Chr04g00339791 [Helianthus anomalus]
MTKMAEKILTAKELEVDSKSLSKSTYEVSGSHSSGKSGKNGMGKTEGDCKNCMKDCKVCRKNAYLSAKKTEEQATKVKTVEDQIISHKSDIERFRKENEKLIHGNRQLSENYDKLKRTIKDSDERNGKIVKTEDSVQSEVVIFTSSSDEDSVQSEVVKTVVENILKSDSDSTKDEECFLNNYIQISKSESNSNEEPTLVMYKMFGSDKLYSDLELPLENVNVDKLNKVFKLIEVDMSEVECLKNSKRMMNFEKDKAYYKKLVVSPHFNNGNQNRWSGGNQGGKYNQKRNLQNKKFVEKKVFVKSSIL